MANVHITYNNNIEKELTRISRELKTLPTEGLQEYKDLTPKRSGNARNKTKLVNQTTILADYDYAQKLDEGYSNQAPNGMTEPFNKWLDKEVSKRIRK